MIVTFSCSSRIHIYENGCGLNPTPPYKIHNTKQDAIYYLLSIGKDNITEIVYPAINREEYLQKTFPLQDKTTYIQNLDKHLDWHPDSHI